MELIDVDSDFFTDFNSYEFDISITRNVEHNGMLIKNVVSSYYLNKANAAILIKELTKFIEAA